MKATRAAIKQVKRLAQVEEKLDLIIRHLGLEVPGDEPEVSYDQMITELTEEPSEQPPVAAPVKKAKKAKKSKK